MPAALELGHVLQGQSAVVTGGSSGIGKAVAIALGRAGANVLVNYARSSEGAAEVVSAIRETGAQASSHQADVSDEASVAELFRRCIGEFGTVDILVANAGIQQDAAIEDMTLDEWQRVISINLTGQFLCAREAIREFRRRGVVKSVSRAAGKIICMSSVHQLIPWAGHVNYAASKGGLDLLMRSLAQEVASSHIRINSIAPGAIRTQINRAAWETPDAYQRLLKLIPYGRIGEPEEVGRLAVWLASDLSDYVVGSTIFIDGGMSLYPGFQDNG